MKVVQLALDKHIQIIKKILLEDEQYTNKLTALVSKVTTQCRDKKDYMTLLGLGLDTKSIPTFQSLIALMQQNNDDITDLISSAVNHCRHHLPDRIFRDKFLEVIEQYYSSHLDLTVISINEKAMN